MGPGAAIFFILLVAGGFAVYIYLMLFHPEWVGITGKEAHKTMDEHKEGSQVDDSDFFEKR